MTDNARNDVPAVAENRTSHRNFRRRKPWHQGRGSAQKAQGNKQGKPQPKIFFCGDPHGEFEYINRTVEKYHPDAIVILGDLQPPEDLETLLAPTLALTQVWWIPGNHDTDCEEYYDRLWHGPIAEHNLHGRVADVVGLRIAGLGGVFRGQLSVGNRLRAPQSQDESLARRSSASSSLVDFSGDIRSAAAVQGRYSGYARSGGLS